MHKIKIHGLTYFGAFLSVITGHFHEFFFCMLLIFIHEMGHVSMILYYRWNIDEIVFLPFGGLTKLKEKINKPMKEEFLITIMGPLFQIIGYFILSYWITNPLFFYFHISLLFFNLLPIFPLDGSKLCHLILEVIMPYKKSHIWMLGCSWVTILFTVFFLLFHSKNFLFFLILLFLGIRIIEEGKKHRYYFEKFLLERFLYSFHFQKEKRIMDGDLKKMYRPYRHLFYDHGKYYTERDFLKKRFDFQRKV